MKNVSTQKWNNKKTLRHFDNGFRLEILNKGDNFGALILRNAWKYMWGH